MSVLRSRLSVITLAGLILPATVASTQTHRAVDNRVWITGDGGYVEAIDKTTHTATTLASTLPNTFGVAVDRDFVWMTSPGSGRSLLKIDKATQSVAATIDLGIANATPRGIAVDPDFVWVADQFIGAVSVVDKRSHAVLRTIVVGPDPMGIAVDDRYAWVATEGANVVARISKLDFSVTTIAVGSLPQGIAVDRHSVWVANAGSNDVSRIDKATGTVIATIPVGTTPRSVAVDGSFAWVLSQSTNTVEKISKASNTVLTTMPAGPSAGSAGNPGISIDASFVWVANGAAGTITQLSKRNGALIASTSVSHFALMHGDATGYSFDSFWPLSAPADAARDFTDTDNPNGAWTYGWTPRRGETPFTLFTAHVDRAPGVTGWGISFTDELVVTHNTNAAATSERTIVHRPEVVDLHPGSTGENSVVRWTAFEPGVYVFRGYFEGADVVGTTTDVSVLQNASTSLFESAINGYQNRKPFNVTVAALAGETVDFAVGYGSNGSYFFDTTSLVVSVERVTDAVAAFSATRNPNGPWQYGWTATRGGSPLEMYGVAVAKLPGVLGWGRTATDEMLATHNTGATAVQERTVVHRTDLIDLHPGPGGERGVLRWTAASAGAYRVNGRVEGIDTAGTTTDVALLRNGIALRDLPISGFGDARVFDVQVGLEPGDTIDLSVGYGANATYFNDSTGVAMVITPIVAPLDVTSPLLTLPGPLSAPAETAAGAVVHFQISAVDDVDPAPVVGCQPSSGTTFAVGRTVVTCQAMDGSGKIASGTFDVVVTDTAPVLDLVPADIVLEATSPAGAKAEWTAPTATDAVDGRIVLACAPASGTILPLGEHAVNCSGSDNAANSVSTSFTVRVVDTQFPEVMILSPTVDSALTGSHAEIVGTCARCQRCAAGPGQRSGSCSPCDIRRRVDCAAAARVRESDTAVRQRSRGSEVHGSGRGQSRSCVTTDTVC